MIKIIAFDLVGVLVNEQDVELTEKEYKLERLFGDNLNDSDYLIEARKIIDKDSIIVRTTEDIINKLYKTKDKNLFKNIKNKYNDIKIIIATNHISYIRNFVGETFEIDYLDDILISAEIHKIKPNVDFFYHILDKYNIKPDELLFLDDNINNTNGAKKLGIKTIKVDNNTDIYSEIINILNKQGI